MDVGAYLATVAGKCFIGLIFFLTGYAIFNHATNWSFACEIKRGNMAAAVVIAVFLFALGLIIAWA